MPYIYIYIYIYNNNNNTHTHIQLNVTKQNKFYDLEQVLENGNKSPGILFFKLCGYHASFLYDLLITQDSFVKIIPHHKLLGEKI